MYDLPPHPPSHFVYALPSPFLASIFKIPPVVVVEKYQDLVCTEQDRANIYDIISTIAKNNKLTLLLKQGYLNSLGAQISHVHPLKFLSTIFTNPELAEGMQDVFEDYFKRSHFMGGLQPHLDREAAKDKLEIFLPDFAAETQISLEKLRVCVREHNWEGIVRLLLRSSS
jgi:hypothetical protein